MRRLIQITFKKKHKKWMTPQYRHQLARKILDGRVLYTDKSVVIPKSLTIKELFVWEKQPEGQTYWYMAHLVVKKVRISISRKESK